MLHSRGVKGITIPPFMALAVLGAWIARPGLTAAAPHPSTGGKTCASCHAAITAKKVVHWPAKENMCDTCHRIPVGGGPSALTEAPEKLCLTCHGPENFSAKFVHGPVAAGACLACHDPHSTATPRLVRAQGKALCLTCHIDMEARLTNAKFQHKAIEVGCTGCHSPHASPLRYQLKADAPGLCASCHSDILERASTATTKHEPVKDQRACLNCHDPHATDYRPQLKADGATICLNCHNKKIPVGGVELADMKTLLAENPDHHGPIRQKNCAGCHQPHGSNHFRLLAEEYPKDFYAPFQAQNFALCFRCHDPALPRDEHTTTLTGFRDGDRNLHFVHVNRAPKGRTCRSCHETHAATLPKRIRKSVPFGRWELPVNFNKTATGGSCAPGCHAPRSYDREAKIQAKAQ